MSLSPEGNPFQPYTIFELADVTELHPFEDSVARYISPKMRPQARRGWEARTRLQDDLRPLKFNGRIANIQLQVMDDPAEKLETARERGFAFKPGKASKSQRARLAFYEEYERALGFTYIANAKSSGRGVIGQVQAEIWYQPDLEYCGVDSAIQRIATIPKIETEDFIFLEEDSKRIAFAALRSAISRARPNGFHN